MLTSGDGGIFAQSKLGQSLQRNELDLPENSVVGGDSAFPLTTYLMKPYSTTPTNRERTIHHFRNVLNLSPFSVR